MFAVYIITMGLSLCTAVLAVCSYKIADHVETLEKQLEEKKKEKR